MVSGTAFILSAFAVAFAYWGGFDHNVLLLLRQKLNGDPANAVISGKNSQASVSQKPHHYWVSATCDAVRLPSLLSKTEVAALSGAKNPLLDIAAIPAASGLWK